MLGNKKYLKNYTLLIIKMNNEDLQHWYQISGSIDDFNGISTKWEFSRYSTTHKSARYNCYLPHRSCEILSFPFFIGPVGSIKLQSTIIKKGLTGFLQTISKVVVSYWCIYSIALGPSDYDNKPVEMRELFDRSIIHLSWGWRVP